MNITPQRVFELIHIYLIMLIQRHLHYCFMGAGIENIQVAGAIAGRYHAYVSGAYCYMMLYCSVYDL